MAIKAKKLSYKRQNKTTMATSECKKTSLNEDLLWIDIYKKPLWVHMNNKNDYNKH